MKCRMKREFTRRNFRKRFEATPKARKIIDKKKFYGVKINIKVYRKSIVEHFFNKSLLINSLGGDGDIFQKMQGYFFKIRSYDNLLKIAGKNIIDAFKKGSKRVMDNSGDIIKLEEPIKETSAELIKLQQTEYYDNITKAQSDKVNNIIQKGIDEGKIDKQVADEIIKSIKSITEKRAIRIARTEIVKVHTIGQIETMHQAGIEEYNYITSNDKKVSKICSKHQGAKGKEKIYKTAYAGTSDNPLPVLNSHPNCRCVAVAYIKS